MRRIVLSSSCKPGPVITMRAHYPCTEPEYHSVMLEWAVFKSHSEAGAFVSLVQPVLDSMKGPRALEKRMLRLRSRAKGAPAQFSMDYKALQWARRIRLELRAQERASRRVA